MSEDQQRVKALLSVQRAIAGEIVSQMRAISIEVAPKFVKLWVYYDGNPSSEVMEDFDAGAITQVVADFPYPEKNDPKIEFEFVECERPLPIPIKGKLVFAFKGEKFQQ